jgi:hypothetical protein
MAHLANVGEYASLADRRTIETSEIIRASAGGSEKRGKIVLFTDHIVAMREA